MKPKRTHRTISLNFTQVKGLIDTLHRHSELAYLASELLQNQDKSYIETKSIADSQILLLEKLLKKRGGM